MFNFKDFYTHVASSIVYNSTLPFALYFQLATINGTMPAVRTVVYRGFFGEMIKVTTNLHTAKVEQIKLNPYIETCWYFPLSREQYRIKHNTLIIGDTGLINKDAYKGDLKDEDFLNERQSTWDKMSPESKKEFLTINQLRAGLSIKPTSDFGLILIEPKECEYYLAKDPFTLTKF